jgi:urease accessory protein UreH
VVQVDYVAGRSRLVRSVSQDPLKLLPTRSGDSDCCSVVVSNYGGGFLQGDRAHLDVNCSAGARLYLGTQALNKVYRCPLDDACQTITGHVGADARVASLPDPVMLFAESRFRQRQQWEVEEGAILAVSDGMVSGRSAMGESFDFTSYSYETVVTRAGKPVAIDRTRCEPDRLDPRGIAAFGVMQVNYSLIMVGSQGDRCFERTSSALEGVQASLVGDQFVSTFARPKPDVVIARLMASSFLFAENPIRKLNGIVAECLLDFDPMKRK